MYVRTGTSAVKLIWSWKVSGTLPTRTEFGAIVHGPPHEFHIGRVGLLAWLFRRVLSSRSVVSSELRRFASAFKALTCRVRLSARYVSSVFCWCARESSQAR